MGDGSIYLLHCNMQGVLLLVIWNEVWLGSNWCDNGHGRGLVYKEYSCILQIQKWNMAGEEGDKLMY